MCTDVDFPVSCVVEGAVGVDFSFDVVREAAEDEDDAFAVHRMQHWG